MATKKNKRLEQKRKKLAEQKELISLEYYRDEREREYEAIEQLKASKELVRINPNE